MKLWALALATVVAGVGGCTPFSGGSFVCADNAECTEGGGGRCEANGACSFADSECASGQRYGDSAGSLAGACVGDEPISIDASTIDADPDQPDADPSVPDAAPGTPDATPMPDADTDALCDAKYGGSVDYELCQSTSATCEFYVRTNEDTCTNQCAKFGGTCVAAYDNIGGMTCTVGTPDEGCGVIHATQVCTCTLP